VREGLCCRAVLQAGGCGVAAAGLRVTGAASSRGPTPNTLCKHTHSVLPLPALSAQAAIGADKLFRTCSCCWRARSCHMLTLLPLLCGWGCSCLPPGPRGFGCFRVSVAAEGCVCNALHHLTSKSVTDSLITRGGASLAVGTNGGLGSRAYVKARGRPAGADEEPTDTRKHRAQGSSTGRHRALHAAQGIHKLHKDTRSM
jgi:hypothetical protein